MVTFINKRREKSVHSLHNIHGEENVELQNRISYTKDILHSLVQEAKLPAVSQ